MTNEPEGAPAPQAPGEPSPESTIGQPDQGGTTAAAESAPGGSTSSTSSSEPPAASGASSTDDAIQRPGRPAAGATSAGGASSASAGASGYPGWPGTAGPGGTGAGYQGPPSGSWPPPPNPPAWAQTLSAQARALRRSRHDRVLAGVAGGIAQRLGIDALLVRVVFVVLAFFGGAGVLLYALGWLLVPDEGSSASVIEQALGRNRDRRGSTLALAIGLGLLVLATAASLLSGSWDGALLLGLLALGAAYLLRRREESTPVGDGQRFRDIPGAWGTSGPAGGAGGGIEYPGYPSSGPSTAGYPAGGSSTASSYGYPGSYADPALGYGYAAPGEGPAGYGSEWAATTAVAQRPPRPKSVLFPVTASIALVVVGFIGVFDAWSGRDVPAATYLASVLAVVGAALVLGTWFGRSRLLIALGLGLALALGPAAASHAWQRQTVDRTFVFTTADEVAATNDDFGAGSLVYDLASVDFSGRTVEMKVALGAGQVQVIVPDGVGVQVSYDVGVGEVNVFDTNVGGFGLQDTFVEQGTADAGQVNLDLQVGVGDVEVSRAQA